MSAYLRYYMVPKKSDKVKKTISADSIVLKDQSAKVNAINNALSEVHQIQDALRNRVDQHEEANRNVRRYILEYQKKFTLSAACIVLFLIGAPLGAIIRKGGLGLPVVVSIIFFLIYYIIGTIGEKSAKEGEWSPVTGAWIGIVILLPIGLFLTYKAATDSSLFDIEIYRRFIGRIRFWKRNRD